MVLSVGSMAVSYSTVQYLYRTGNWNPDSMFSHDLQTYSACAILAALALAIAAMFRDRPLWPGAIALVVSFFGVLSIATG
jgi:hypothetical protein